MRKFHSFLLSLALMLVGVGANAQTSGYNRLQNVTTGHVANLSGGLHFAPDVTLDEAYALPGTVAYADFDGQKVTELRAQGVDVVNTLVPMMKAMMLEVITEEKYAELQGMAIEKVETLLPGAMGTMLVNLIKNYTYADFQVYVSDLDTSLYYTEVEGGYRLLFNSPPFPFNAGDFTSYLTKKTNDYLSLYRGTLQEMASEYLVGREYLKPMVDSFIKNILFGDYLYLCEMEDPEYGPYIGFANSSNIASTENKVWNFIPVDDDNYVGVKGSCKDGDGKWWAALVVDFPYRLPDGMKAYYVDGEVDYTKSLIRRVAVTDEVIPALTPVILQLNGEGPAANKLDIVADNTSVPYEGNALTLPTDSLGLLLGFTLSEPSERHFVLGITDGKPALLMTSRTVFTPYEPYYFLPDNLVGVLTSGYLILADEVSGIEEHMATVNDDNTVYDLQGRRVDNPTKGIYIINGKKVIRR
ncbi:MAG: hypothetical protein J5637_00730 [Prevotella sp.]|nr:hypothetical protein [Prevotella sp.]